MPSVVQVAQETTGVLGHVYLRKRHNANFPQLHAR